MSVDAELRDIAERAAARYTDALLAAQGWTRTELVDAIHGRLCTKYREMRDTGRLYRDNDGRIVADATDNCPTPTKWRYRTKSAARRYQKRHPPPGDPLWPYECPAGGHWHLTHQTPDQQREISARIAKAAIAPTVSTQQAMSRPQEDKR